MKKNKKIIYIGISFFIIVLINLYININLSGIKNIIYSPFSILNNKEEMEYDLLKSLYDSSLEEIKTLKEIIEISKNLEYVPAVIINRDNYFNEIVINKGSNNSINVGDAVISNNSLVGVITEVGKNYSNVLLITNEYYENKISIEINGNYGLLVGYNDIKNSFLVTNITGNITVGDIIKTGYSNNIEQGILVGTVESINYDSFLVDNTIEVKSDVNFLNLKYVLVMTK